MAELKRFIHKLHYRTFDKIWPHVHEHYPEVTEQQVKDIIKGFVKDPPSYKLKQHKYYNKIFSDHPHAWMMDLLENTGQTPDYNNKAEVEANEHQKQYPDYWYIFININTRFAVAYPLFDKNRQQILIVLRRFLSQFRCASLTSDKESAFIAQETVRLLRDHNISQYIVADNNHTSVSIITIANFFHKRIQ